MKRIDAADAAPGNLFTDGDPLVPIRATVLDASWLNMVQEEIVNVVLGAGIALSPIDNTQLDDAIRALILSSMVAHLAAANPHPQYLLAADLTSASQAVMYQLGLAM